jgi:hypothetical protein
MFQWERRGLVSKSLGQIIKTFKKTGPTEHQHFKKLTYFLRNYNFRSKGETVFDSQE